MKPILRQQYSTNQEYLQQLELCVKRAQLQKSIGPLKETLSMFASQYQVYDLQNLQIHFSDLMNTQILYNLQLTFSSQETVLEVKSVILQTVEQLMRGFKQPQNIISFCTNESLLYIVCAPLSSPDSVQLRDQSIVIIRVLTDLLSLEIISHFQKPFVEQLFQLIFSRDESVSNIVQLFFVKFCSISNITQIQSVFVRKCVLCVLQNKLLNVLQRINEINQIQFKSKTMNLMQNEINNKMNFWDQIKTEIEEINALIITNANTEQQISNQIIVNRIQQVLLVPVINSLMNNLEPQLNYFSLNETQNQTDYYGQFHTKRYHFFTEQIISVKLEPVVAAKIINLITEAKFTLEQEQVDYQNILEEFKNNQRINEMMNIKIQDLHRIIAEVQNKENNAELVHELNILANYTGNEQISVKQSEQPTELIAKLKRKQIKKISQSFPKQFSQFIHERMNALNYE
ncbi:Hypothetical_protein [Hexamita inflata]|uniref:Hypothetical_protein n=1 Tax=Hexamita inflata TaxID=28002 RepID=A0AA86PWP4_9EUKA|nr:Hypothetical protein HINF_LOCUS30067 [Hexamita inflata]